MIPRLELPYSRCLDDELPEQRFDM